MNPTLTLRTRYSPAGALRWSESTAYLFAIGRMKALEPLFLDRSYYRRLIAAPAAADFLRELADSRYGEFIDREGATKPAQLFSRAETAALSFTLEYVPEEWFRTVLLLPLAVVQLKASLKRQLAQRSDTGPVTGPESPFRSTLPPTVAERLAGYGQEALVRAEQADSPALIDFHLDQKEFELTLELCRNHDFARTYYQLAADLVNLKTLLRLRLLPAARITLEQLLVAGGSLPVSELRPLAGAEPETWHQFFRGTVFAELVRRGLEVRPEQGWFVRVEQEARRLLLAHVNRARYVALGYEPVFRFYRLWENEITNLRLIYAAKVAGLPAALIEELVVYAE